MAMKELTERQIERQDYVDNQIFDLIQNLVPTTSSVRWSIEMIGDVRETIREWLVKRLQTTGEMQFYPYLEE